MHKTALIVHRLIVASGNIRDNSHRKIKLIPRTLKSYLLRKENVRNEKK